MKLHLKILRRKDRGSEPFWQVIPCETDDVSMTVATLLNELNARTDLRDADGNAVSPVRWECSCLQKKCGACAMLINGRPGLACDTFILQNVKHGEIRLEPLSKFPVVSDLIVDRREMFENLKALNLWSGGTAKVKQGIAIDSASCLQCGCCLEICPNFRTGGAFFGAAGAVSVARMLAQLSEKSGKAYTEHVYEGCGKSLQCEKICPAGIDITELMSRSNGVAVWKRHFRESE